MPAARDPRSLWRLDRGLAYLNHGSFGATPIAVLDAQRALQDELERQPMAFFAGLEARLDRARAAVAGLVGCAAADLAFTANATTAVNAVLRSYPLTAGDELLIIDHAYNACANAARFVAERAGARVVIARLPFPIAEPAQAIAAIVGAVTDRTRLALIDHVTSPTALVLPVRAIAGALADRGVDVLVDGAHAPGMVDLDLDDLATAGVSYYAGNLHKWVCAPKSVGFLHVRGDRQASVRPTVISHGANDPRCDRSRFLLEFDWVGTHDPTPILAVPTAIATMAALHPDGWPGLMAANRAGVLAARDRVAGTLGVDPPAPDSMIGSMASLPLPPGQASDSYVDPLQTTLLDQHRIQTVIPYWPAPPARLVRLSYQVYNRPAEYDALADALRDLLN